MRTIPLIRCLPKMSPSSSTSTGSQIATWRRSLAWTRHDSTPISNHCWRERYSSDCQRFSLNPVQRDILPHRQSQLSDLTIRLQTRREFSFDLQSLLTGKIFVWLPAFLSEPGSARYSSATSITSVWSNYQTSYNDFFEVYITETVTLSPIFKRSTNSKQCHVTTLSVIPVHKYVNVQASADGSQQNQ